MCLKCFTGTVSLVLLNSDEPEPNEPVVTNRFVSSIVSCMEVIRRWPANAFSSTETTERDGQSILVRMTY
jgi:hypothetical protein